jgi:hypothetical protein
MLIWLIVSDNVLEAWTQAMHSVSIHAQSPMRAMVSGSEAMCEVSMKKVALYTQIVVANDMIPTSSTLWGGRNILELMKHGKGLLPEHINTSASRGNCVRSVVNGNLAALYNNALKRAEGAVGSLCLQCVQSESFGMHLSGCSRHS